MRRRRRFNYDLGDYGHLRGRFYRLECPLLGGYRRYYISWALLLDRRLPGRDGGDHKAWSWHQDRVVALTRRYRRRRGLLIVGRTWN